MPLVVGTHRIAIAVVANKKGRSERVEYFGALVLQLFISGPFERRLKMSQMRVVCPLNAMVVTYAHDAIALSTPETLRKTKFYTGCWVTFY
ncbi:hypothetical protein [Pseudovibrio exalbescens]|uniref:hypothetical protein n=1 Tax=Pseudovibrio exalbescens TaxID=197461 RepID=UPI0015E143E2|nr:hypothetical protein [Pseudovibrio exalbescens]